MKIKDLLESEDHDDAILPSVNQAKSLMPKILAAAQKDYDSWDESEIDTYAGGGICHIIANSICGVLYEAGIECTPVSCDYEQHVYVAAKFEEGVYTIDIPYHIYEEGGGFSWKKLPDIVFEPGDVIFYKVTSDPDEFENYVLSENFADGRNPEDKGDSKRHRVPTKASISTLRKVAKQGGRKGQLAHWLANMKSGRAKAKKK